MAIRNHRFLIPSSSRLSGRKREEGSLREDRQQLSLSMAAHHQSSIGNQATGRMLRALPEMAEATAATRGLSGASVMTVHWLATAARASAQHEIWRAFESCSPGQRLAILQEWTGSNNNDHSLIGAPVDWDKLLVHIKSVKEVKLEPDEPEKQANIEAQRAQVPKGNINVSGLLAPYRDIMLWLSYKANKQGEAMWLQRFNALSIPQIRWTLHKMVQSRTLTFTTFKEAVTKTLLQKEWIDWEKLRKSLEKTEQIKLHLSDERTVERLLDDDSVENSLHGPELLLGNAAFISALAQDEETDSPVDHHALQDPDHVGWLLFGIKDTSQQASKPASNIPIGTPDSIVDRFLRVSPELPGKKRVQIRQHLLKKHGFHSTRQCYIYLLTSIVGTLFERGVIQKEKPFIRLLETLGLTFGKTALSRDRIAHKLRASQ